MTEDAFKSLLIGKYNVTFAVVNSSLNYTAGDVYSFLESLHIDNFTRTDVERLLTSLLGVRRKDLLSVVALTFVYSLLFLTGLIGNISTCIVVARNTYMRTVTNYYLFSLAVSDVLILIFALPPEVFSIWEAYPWHFGEEFCIFKTFLMEMTSYATVLTITGFTIERYIAICHPIRGQRTCSQSRAVKCIFSIWIVACLCALPYPIHTRVFYFVTDPWDGKPVPDSLLCNIPFQWQERMTYVFQISTFVFFVLPMCVITVMYALIGIKLRRKEIASSAIAQSQSAKTAAARARRAVLKMLVAVVVAFFLCWAPFHSQRLMTLYVQTHQWTPELLTVQSHLFYVSGVLYFLSSTVNPILYNLLSRRFRQAFKRTLCRCCLDIDSLPAFYKLKAKFIGHESDRPRDQGKRPMERCYLHPIKHPKNAHIAKFSSIEGVGPGAGACRAKGLVHQSTRESFIKISATKQPSYSSFVSSGEHAHSDGRLLAICRHKYCSSRRANLARGPCNGNSIGDPYVNSQRRFVMSYPDVIPMRLLGDLRRFSYDNSINEDSVDDMV